MVFYDVYFEVNGQRVEPADGLVEVSMNFKTPVLELLKMNRQRMSQLFILMKKRIPYRMSQTRLK